MSHTSNRRKIFDIHGGIHPAENKRQSLQSPIQPIAIPAELVFPLSQHIGAPAEPVVAVGDRVLKGQMIARANGMMSVPVHASTSGTVVAIETRPVIHPSGLSAPCIVLSSDGRDEWLAHHGTDDYTQLDKATLIAMIRDAGIAGMGGAGFPAAVKLNTRPDRVIETLIINGTECEPHITADDILMRERPQQVIQGALILKHIVNPASAVLIGVEDNKPESIAALRQAAEGTGIEVVSFPTKYPSGGEKQLIQILTGKQVPAGGLPADIGIVCQNVGTTVAICKAVQWGEPLISRITTVTGNAVKSPQNYETLLGTPVSHLLAQSGFDDKMASRVIIGGPMMGFAIDSLEAPLVKTSNCILAPTAQELPVATAARACMRCGMCAEACPVSLLPQQLFWFAQAKNHQALKDHHLFDCIECGACSYSCPSHIPLVQYYRASKADIRKAEADHKKAEYSKTRFEARLERLAKMEAEKEAKRKERQEKAARTEAEPTGSATESADRAAIQAAIERTKKTAPVADPVQAAIARAQAKRDAQGGAEDTGAKLASEIASLEKRIEKAQEKLQAAMAEGSDTVAVLTTSLEKLQEKLDKARQESGQSG